MTVSMFVFPEETGWPITKSNIIFGLWGVDKGYKSHAGWRVCILFLAHREPNCMHFRGGVWWILCSWNAELMSGRGYFLCFFFLEALEVRGTSSHPFPLQKQTLHPLKFSMATHSSFDRLYWWLVGRLAQRRSSMVQSWNGGSDRVLLLLKTSWMEVMINRTLNHEQMIKKGSVSLWLPLALARKGQSRGRRGIFNWLARYKSRGYVHNLNQQEPEISEWPGLRLMTPREEERACESHEDIGNYNSFLPLSPSDNYQYKGRERLTLQRWLACQVRPFDLS